MNDEKEMSKGDLIALKQGSANPPLMDFITIKATLPGFVSYRSSNKDKDSNIQYNGSFFIQALCQTLSDEYLMGKPCDYTSEGKKDRDLESILKCVQPKINKCSVASKVWQTMSWEACLSKCIRFRGVQIEDTDI